MATSYTDNTIYNRGLGRWQFILYKPEDHRVGPLRGELLVGKDFHTVMLTLDNGQQKFIASFPSQNIAYVVDVDHATLGVPPPTRNTGERISQE